MLIVRDTYRSLLLEGTDLLAEWLGPPLRGLVARHFKDRVCVHPPAERDERWKYCKGCPGMQGCPYGETLEPDPPRLVDAPPGHDDAARALVIAPDFPANPHAPVPVRATFLGPAAGQHAGAFWEAAAAAGRLPHQGLGPARIRYQVAPSRPDRLSVVDVPLNLAAVAGVVPRLRLELQTPLNLEARDGNDRKRLVSKPGFADLFRASLRTLASLHRLYAHPLPDAGFAELKQAADAVKTLGADYHPLHTRQRSNRSGQAVDIEGVIGSVVFAEVPLSLARWLYWGGRVHVGGLRVKGHGAWSLAWSLDPAANLKSGPGLWTPWG